MGIKRPFGVTVYRRKRSDRRNGVSAYLQLRTPIPKTLISRIFIHRYSYVMIFQIFIMLYIQGSSKIRDGFNPGRCGPSVSRSWSLWRVLQGTGPTGDLGRPSTKPGNPWETCGKSWQIMGNHMEPWWAVTPGQKSWATSVQSDFHETHSSTSDFSDFNNFNRRFDIYNII